MVDSHCHLTDSRLGDQLGGVIARARGAGVSMLVTIGTSPDDSAAAVALAEQYPDTVRAVVGVHPNYCGEVALDALSRIQELAAHPLVVAVGEMGLDYFHNHADRRRQRLFFERQLAIAVEVNQPVVIHSRQAVADALMIVQSFAPMRAVFHCFTGTVDEAQAIVEAGHYVGFTGPITYKNNDILRQAVEFVPLDRILIETDAPYLSPDPVRATKICEPAFVAHTLRQLALIKGISEHEADTITTRNTRQFYGL
jgi:TatD DNase family protein